MNIYQNIYLNIYGIETKSHLVQLFTDTINLKQGG
jgi:hypothetical protein